MPNPLTPGALRRLPLALLLLSAAPVALAQSYVGRTVERLPSPNDPAEQLARALRTLAASPNDVSALLSAGDNALALGDPNAAVGFFGRASGIEPRNGRAKAGLGSALVQMERPAEALRLFGEARQLGVPQADIAADQGLAYDLSGDQRRAQQDYAIQLSAHPDDEQARRRLALSQGIAGDRAGAIATLDPLIRKRDIAAWRAQTFVLAMTGDTKGAQKITEVMLPQQSAMLQPFLVRLAGLSPADKARAVHFGEMPENGRGYTPSQLANIGTTPTYQPLPSQQTAAASTPTAAGRSDLAPVAAQQARPLAAMSQPAAAPVRTAEASAPHAQPASAADASVPLPTAAANGHYDLPHAAPRVAMRTVGTPVVHEPRGRAAARDRAEAAKPVELAAAADTRDSHHTRSTKADEATDATAASKSRHAKPSTADGSDEADASHGRHSKAKSDSDDSATSRKQHDVSADEQASDTHGKRDRHGKAKASDEADDRGSAKGRHGKSDSADESDKHDSRHRSSKSKASDASDEGDQADTRHGHAKSHGKASDESSSESRHGKSAETGSAKAKIYVQVAGGANKDDLDKAWSGVKKKAPELMKGHHPSTTPLRATNRLLVGPFKDEDEAQAFVNKMAGKGLSGFIFKSEKGQKVDKIDTGK